MPGKGLVVMLTEVEGTPTLGTVVDFLGGHRTIVDIGKNATDGQPVSTRDGLTGRTVPPYGTILIDWPEGTPAPNGIQGAEVKEVVLL